MPAPTTQAGASTPSVWPLAERFLDWVAAAAPLPELRAAESPHAAIWNLWGPARTLALAAHARDREAFLCIVTPTQADAERVADTLAPVYGAEAIGILPPREYLPAGDTLPVDEVTGDRLAVLKALATNDPTLRVLVGPVHAFMQTCATPEWVREQRVSIRQGETIAPDELAQCLVRLGFERVVQVEKPGHISLRGGIFDIFPPCNAGGPVRIEFFGDDVDSIRQFDVGTQISFQRIRAMDVMPRLRTLELPEGAHLSTATPLDYLPAHALIGWWEPHAIEAEYARLTDGDLLKVEQGSWRTIDAIAARSAAWPSLAVSQTGTAPRIVPIDAQWSAHTAGLSRFARDLDAFWPNVHTWLKLGRRVAIFASSEGEADRLEELCRDHGLDCVRTDAPSPDATLQITRGRWRAGVDWPDAGWVLVSEQELYGRSVRRRARRRFHAGKPIEHFTDLRIGDYVVHTEHGIGIYRGLVYVAESQADFLLLEYQDGDKLYVPIDQMDLVQRYVGGETPAIHRLGSPVWHKTKSRVQKAIQQLAGQLVELYAARQARPGFAFPSDSDWQREFEASFPFELTPDQSVALTATKADMESPHPMDRLLCGDVGYGKTEIAVRAAFKAVLGGKQVAVLVPTTVLAQQHYQTFTERMAEFPVRIGMLSRLRTAGENDATLAKLAAGELDIVIGTHRVVQKDVSFHALGLVIIDEEQRFGVTHKERLKQLRTQVDVLTLTATPIPRTLHLALMGARDLSIIHTAPEGRLPIVTVVEPYDPTIVRDAIRRELAREGQVYFVHNRVETIAGFAEEIRALTPEARIAVAHGQMKPRELENVMLRFLTREFDVLISTTIIENGLDIPNVNTILIDRADRFGLAQLYQLRGRVGRFTHRAYAYLLLPEHTRITVDAEQRLEAITEYTELGAGLSLALRDLEIRGAGNLLGAEQSGDISAVGFDMYCQLIADAVKHLRGETVEEVSLPRVELGVPAFIPDDYVVSPMQKLGLYKRITLLRKLPEVGEFAHELADRYGPLPDPLINVLRISEIRILGARAGIEFIGRIRHDIVFRSAPATPLDPATLRRLSETYGRLLRCEAVGAPKLLMPITPETEPKLVPLVRRIIGDIAASHLETTAAAVR